MTDIAQRDVPVQPGGAAMTEATTLNVEQFIGEVMGSFDTASIAPGKRFFLRETAQDVGRLYALLHASELHATELRPALWEISNSGAERFTYTLTRDDYEAYTARGDSTFLGALRRSFGEDVAWITG